MSLDRQHLVEGTTWLQEELSEFRKVQVMDKGQAAMEVSLAGDAPWAEAPAGYKRTEVGVIPQEWTLGRLADFGVFRSGSGFPLVYQGLPSGDYPFFKVSDMNNQGNELSMKVANHWIDEKGGRNWVRPSIQLGVSFLPKSEQRSSWKGSVSCRRQAVSTTT